MDLAHKIVDRKIAGRRDLVRRRDHSLHLDIHREIRQAAVGVGHPSSLEAEVLLEVDIHEIVPRVVDRTVPAVALVRKHRHLPVVAASLRCSIGLEVVVYDRCIVPRVVKHQACIHLRGRRWAARCYDRSHILQRKKLAAEPGLEPEYVTGTDPEAGHRLLPWRSDLWFVPGSTSFPKPFRDRARLVRWSKQTTRLPRHVHDHQLTSGPGVSRGFCHS